MQVNKKNRLLSEAGLLLCGLIWGSGFVVMKNSLDALPMHWLLAIRFVFAAAPLVLIFFKKIKSASAYTIKGGLLCGITIYLGYAAQTYGLQFTTAGNNAFLTAVYVVLVPFVYWVSANKKPGMRTIAAGVICLIGVGVIALDSTLKVDVGSMWTLVCGVLYAIHIVMVSVHTARGADIMALTAIQFASTSVCATFAALLFEDIPSVALILRPDVITSLLYLAVLCSIVSLLIENVALKYAPPSAASLLMSTEAVFGCLFGVIFLSEPVTLRFIMGALIIMGAILLSELRPKATQEIRNS